MTQTSEHLIFSKFEGYADLESPEYGIVLPGVSVRFDAQKLEFEVFLKASNDLLKELDGEFSSTSFWLRDIKLKEQKTGIKLEAKKFYVDLQKAFFESPDRSVLFLTGCDWSNESVRRLVLAPSVKELKFCTTESISGQYPYQVYYSSACAGLGVSDPLKHKSLLAPVRFLSCLSQTDLLCALSEENFLFQQKRIHAALSLAHGRDLRLTLIIREGFVNFYGYPISGKNNYLPMVREKIFPECKIFFNQLLYGFMELPDCKFEHANLTLRFFLQAKQSQIVEVGFLQAMICVEAMDGMEDLQQETTKSMLGIESNSAKLLNCMRNKLVHGKGGCSQAFDEVFSKDFKGDRPNLEKEFEGSLKNDNTLDFIFLWFRLCERLDAFWCAYVGVKPALNKMRYVRHEINLMSAVDLKVLDSVVNFEKAKKENRKKQADLKNAELSKLRNEVRRLDSENKILMAKIQK